MYAYLDYLTDSFSLDWNRHYRAHKKALVYKDEIILRADHSVSRALMTRSQTQDLYRCQYHALEEEAKGEDTPSAAAAILCCSEAVSSKLIQPGAELAGYRARRTLKLV